MRWMEAERLEFSQRGLVAEQFQDRADDRFSRFGVSAVNSSAIQPIIQFAVSFERGETC
jgi:hypothetical protein